MKFSRIRTKYSWLRSGVRNKYETFMNMRRLQMLIAMQYYILKMPCCQRFSAFNIKKFAAFLKKYISMQLYYKDTVLSKICFANFS